MKKLITLSWALLTCCLSFNASATIYGTLVKCESDTATLHDGSFTASTWSSSNPTVATVASAGTYYGIVTGHTAGTAIITCVSSAGTSTAVFTVNPVPTAIAGGTAPICPGATTTLTNATSGGTWSSLSSAATVATATGVVTGVYGGTATIKYTIGTGCATTHVVTVTPLPFVDTIVGPGSVCLGGTATLTCATPGGTWSSSAPAIISVSSGGVVTGVSAGSAIITYSVTGTCGTSYQTLYISTTTTSSPPAVTGPSTVAVGGSVTFWPSTSGGTWSSSNASIASVSSSGIVTGVSAGSAVITYTMPGCTVTYGVAGITVTAPDCINGNVLFGGVYYYGNVKVWLIKYNPSTMMLYAVDSLTAFSTGTSASYSFCGMGTDSFRVKAACIDTVWSTTGYQPTYHTSSAYWNTATVINHTAGTVDAGKDINMNYGTVTSGPGFIAGNVTMGANKGTADPIPAVGLLVYCVNNTTGAIMQQVKTDAAGHYAFSNLPVGTYKIYPELINYATTPYPPITLTTASPSATSANFEQRTISMVIVPITTGVSTVDNAGAGLNIFPNPAKNVVNVSWTVENAGNAVISIADITGRNVLTTNADMSANSGTIAVPVNSLAKGVYLMTIKANGINHTAKLTLE